MLSRVARIVRDCTVCGRGFSVDNGLYWILWFSDGDI